MVSYDYLYEDVTLKEVEYDLKVNGERVAKLKKEVELLLLDLESVHSATAKELLTKEIDKSQIQINRYQKELNGWNKVKKVIENGESITYQNARIIVDGY